MQVGVRNAYETELFPAPQLRVFFDVWRASTTLLAILSQKPECILSTNDLAIVRQYQSEGFLLVSEVFDGGLDNSPTQVLATSLTGKKVIHKSTNLTTAIFANGLAPVTLIGGFVNAERLVAHVAALKPETVELIAAAHFAKGKEAIEDKACAEMIALGLKEGLSGAIPRTDEIAAKLTSLKTRKPDIPSHFWDDAALSLTLNALPILAEVRPYAPSVVQIIVS